MTTLYLESSIIPLLFLADSPLSHSLSHPELAMVDNNEQGQSSLQRESAGKLKSSRSDPIPPSDEDSNGFDSLEVVKAAWKRMQLRQDHDMPPVVGGNGTSEHKESPLSFIGMLLASNFLFFFFVHCQM